MSKSLLFLFIIIKDFQKQGLLPLGKSYQQKFKARLHVDKDNANCPCRFGVWFGPFDVLQSRIVGFGHSYGQTSAISQTGR